MVIRITSLTAHNGGNDICVGIEMSDGENRDNRELFIFSEQYLNLELEKGVISENKYDLLSEEAELYTAIKKGLVFLGYGVCSGKRLCQKLQIKGISRETAQKATEYLCENGYINEVRDASLEARTCIAKRWGKRRIMAHLFSKGYSDTAIRQTSEELDKIDFPENCAEAIKKKYKSLPDDRDAITKLTGAMIRMGYSASEIREALNILR